MDSNQPEQPLHDESFTSSDFDIIDLPDDGQKRIWDNPENVKKLLRIFFGVCGLLLLLDLIFLFVHKHLSFDDHMFPAEGWVGFFCAYGFVACVLLVLTAKQLRKVLMRDEDYYDR